MSKTVKSLTKSEQYVLAKRSADALYAALTPEERTEADKGLEWAEILGVSYGAGNGRKRRGRPVGSRNKGQGAGPAADKPFIDKLAEEFGI